MLALTASLHALSPTHFDSHSETVCALSLVYCIIFYVQFDNTYIVVEVHGCFSKLI